VVRFSAFFTGQKRIRYRLAIGAAAKILTVGAVALVAYLTRSLSLVLLTYMIMDAGLVAVTTLVVRRDFGSLALGFDWSRSLALMKAALPFFIYNILAIVHLRLDTLMVGFMLGFVPAYYDLGMRRLEAASVPSSGRCTRSSIRYFRPGDASAGSSCDAGPADHPGAFLVGSAHRPGHAGHRGR
jgi:O-antigen/teichoic acid export membrane protein